MEMFHGYPKLEDINQCLLKSLIEDAVDWAHAVGMVMRTSERKNSSDICQTAPFTLFPSPFPRYLFDQAMDVQEAMNLLYFRISWDFDFLIRAHKEVVKTDDFIRHMVNILKILREEGIQQTKTLLTQRADYMCHTNDEEIVLRQIEVNNIAVSMGGLSERVSTLHRRTLQNLDVSNETINAALPENKPVYTIAKGIYEAWNDFQDTSAIILFVVEEVNQNQLDQRHIEYQLDEFSCRRIKCVRLTFTECAKRLSLGGNDGYSLLLDNRKRVAIVYFRAGYTPSHYPSETEWATRLLMERSNAVKCPWIGLQLANTKKVQQILTQKDEVERFLPFDPIASAKIRRTFAKIWGLEQDNKLTADIVKKAIADPQSFVLKPQLEGGAGNYYGHEVVEVLQKLNKDELAAHILMERIYPKTIKNFLVRPLQETQFLNAIGELGIYGYLYGNGSFDKNRLTIQSNYAHGHILRTKAETENRGGVAVGAAVIDSVFLY